MTSAGNNGVAATGWVTYKVSGNDHGMPVCHARCVKGSSSIPVRHTVAGAALTAYPKVMIFTKDVAACPPPQLTALHTSHGVLSPGFQAGTSVYAVTSVPAGLATITVTPHAAEVYFVTVEGVNVTSGNPSGAVSLVPPMTNITVRVAATLTLTQILHCL